MPTLTRRRGVLRWRGQVWMEGRVGASKWFGQGREGGQEYKKALLWEEEARAALLKAKEKPETPTDSLTVLEWANEYLSYVEKRRASATYQEKRTTFRFLLSHFPEDTQIVALDEEEAEEYLDAQNEKRSGNAANKDRKNLAHAWKWARHRLKSKGFPQGSNPFREVERYSEDRRPRYIPPENDFWTIYGFTEGQDKVMLTAFLHLAARRGEIFRLTWADIDFGRSQVALRTRKTKDGSWKINLLPMTTELKKVLLWWWEGREHKQSEYVFTVLDRTPFTNQWEGLPFKGRQHFMEKLCLKADVKPFGFHAIRHLSALILYKAGYSVRVIQQILRHESPRTTEKYLRALGLDPEIEEAVTTFENRGPAKVIPFGQEKTLGRASSEG